MKKVRPKRRLSADQVRAKLIAACVDRLEHGGPNAVSARDVAARAGLNHGLVHRHFGGKDKLIAAAIRSISADVHRAGPSGAMSLSSFEFLREHPEIVQLVARACLDGPKELLAIAAPSPDRLADITQQIRAALARGGFDRVVDAHLVNAFATAALLGWFAFRPLLRSGFGLRDDADDQLRALLGVLDRFVVGRQA